MRPYRICIHFRDRTRASEFIYVQSHTFENGVFTYLAGNEYYPTPHHIPLDLIDEIVVQKH